ncbi:MAG: YidC/Oxa1 family membrane protein insertase [Chloroflexota bacterium]
MDAFLPIWNGIIVDPLIGGLKFLAVLTNSGGLAIILFTIAIRMVMLPLSIYQMKSQKAMTAVQPLVKEAQKKFGNDRERMTQETMRIYKEHGVNPASGCLPLLLQMPIFIGLYSALLTLSGVDHGDDQFREAFLWLPSLGAEDPIYVMPILTGITQLVLQRMMTMPSTDPQQQMMNRMMTFMPLVFLGVTFSLPSGLVMYWVVSNVVSMIQQYFTTGWGSLFPLIPGRGGDSSGGNGSVTKSALQSGAQSEDASERPRASSPNKGGAKSSGKRKRGGKR